MLFDFCYLHFVKTVNQKFYKLYWKWLIHLSICCSKPFCSHSLENIDISTENSSISDQNLNPLNLSNKETDCFTELKTFRFKNPKNLIMGHLNINSLRNKFESIKPIISPNFDIFLVSETKLDESFPNNQFSISGYRMFRQDKNCFGGGLCIYVKENIASKQLNLHLDKETEAIYLEINIRSWPKYFRQTVVFLQNSTLWEKFNFYFSRMFC